MDYLRSFAEEYGLEQTVDSVSGQPGVQGAILTIDDRWLEAWRLEEMGYSDRWFRLHWHFLRSRPLPFPINRTNSDLHIPSWIPRRRPNLRWRPPYWGSLSRLMGYSDDMPPIRLVVCMRPPKNGDELTLPEVPKTDLPVSFEVRPVARFSTTQRGKVRPLVGGVSIGAGPVAYGTLGGIVRDQHDQHFGVTCSHVLPLGQSVEQPAQRDDSQATPIGTGALSIALQQCTALGPCNPYSARQHITSVDAALIEISPNITSDLEILSIGPLAGVVDKNSMVPGQEVFFEGRTSGYRVAEVGGLAIFYRLELNRVPYCFRDLFEVRWRSFARTLLGPVVQGGDSGAWVCADTDQGPGWCGQVIGEDRRIGYATFAKNTIAELSNAGKQVHVR